MFYARKTQFKKIIVIQKEFFLQLLVLLGSLQANEVLKTILNFKNDLNNQYFIIFDSIKMNLRKCKN